MDEDKKKVKEALNSEFCENWMKKNIVRVSKNSAISKDMRDSGNEVFKTKNHNGSIHEKAWRNYTSCITTAEKDSQALAFGYGNRSAILIHMSKYKESIKDIDRALAISKDNVFCAKLLLRKAKCLHALKSDASRSTLKDAELLIGKVNDEVLKKTLENNLKEIEGILKRPIASNSEIENKTSESVDSLMKENKINDFSAIKIEFMEKYGRCLIADKDFKSGDVIFVEKPYIQCINLTNMHGFCSHCFNVCWANIPCETCSWAMFCSEKCKTEAWNQYHDIECSVWACAKQPGDCTPQQLALRIMILALKEFGSLENIKAEMEKIDKCNDTAKEFMNGDEIQPNYLKAILSLSTDISQESYLKIHKESIIKMLKSIGLNTELFGNNFDCSNTDSYKANENAILFGTLFLRFSKIGQINGRQIWNHRYYPCPNGKTLVTCPLDKQCCSAGSYIAPVASLLNHSCWPNARVCYGSNNCIIVYAIQSIKKGEQILDCYTFITQEASVEKRQMIHSYVYNFVCDCIVCESKMPFGLELAQLLVPVACQTEVALSRKYYQIIMSSLPKVRTGYDRKTLKHIGKGIEEALETLPEYSGVILCLIFAIQKAYEQVYGISLTFPETCNNM